MKTDIILRCHNDLPLLEKDVDDIDLLFCAPEAARRGVASALYREAEARLRSLECEEPLEDLQARLEALEARRFELLRQKEIDASIKAARYRVDRLIMARDQRRKKQADQAGLTDERARLEEEETAARAQLVELEAELVGLVLHELVEQGNTVVVIEHNLDVVKTADWIVDIGPEGGDGGGEIIAVGTPEDVAKVKRSYTGQYLGPMLKPKKKETAKKKSALKKKPVKKVAAE